MRLRHAQISIARLASNVITTQVKGTNSRNFAVAEDVKSYPCRSIPMPHKRKREPEPDIRNCSRLEFGESSKLKSFIKSAKYYSFELPDISHLKHQFDTFQFAFHKPECRAPVLTTKAGWAMLHDENTIAAMFQAVDTLKEIGIDFREIAKKSFGMEHGYWFIGADRWKSQPVGPGHGTKPDEIVHKCWKEKNSLHVDLREEDEENQLAFLFNFGIHPRHMVITDLNILQEERKKLKEEIAGARGERLQQLLAAKASMGERHMCIYELLHHVQGSKHGFFAGFTPDEKLLLKSALKAVIIPPGHALLFPQFLPHCLTNSTTSADPNARADTFYLGLKMSKERKVLEGVQQDLIEKFAEGGQHVYQREYGRNGFTDARINAEHREKLLPCIFEQYNIPPVHGKTGGRGGISAKNSLPTVAQFVKDVKAARANPEAFAQGMSCPHLDIDRVLIPRDVLQKTMEIKSF